MSIPPPLASDELFADTDEILIEHAGRCYLLVRIPEGPLLLQECPVPIDGRLPTASRSHLRAARRRHRAG